MDEPRHTRFALDAVRTDGWFARIAEGIASCQTLCEVIGERFFAFSIILGIRITALTIDRRIPDQTLVDFVVGGSEDDGELVQQRLTLGEFRPRVVAMLFAEEEGTSSPPENDSDLEALQLFIGVRSLLVAPLYGYCLTALSLTSGSAELTVIHDGIEEQYALEGFREALRAHVQDELEHASEGNRSAIDLSRVAEAEACAERGEWTKIIALLGSWPGPLAIFLRTPEGQLLAAEPRMLIAKGLGLLGTACVNIGEMDQGEEVFRVGIQCAQDGPAAADLFLRLGEALLANGRSGEAIGPLRRALAFGGPSGAVSVLLGRALSLRGRFVAAYTCFQDALAAGVPSDSIEADLQTIEARLGPALGRWALALDGRASAEGDVT